MPRLSITFAQVITCALFVLPCFASEPNRDVSKLVVFDESMGCFHWRKKQTEYALEDGYYFNENTRFPKAYIDGLRELVVSSHQDKTNLLEELGFTPEAVEKNRYLIYRSIRRNACELPEEIPAWGKEYFDYEKLKESALDTLVGTNRGSTTHVTFKVTFPGDPQVTACSKWERPWMLPWSVTVGDKSRESYSLLIPKALGVLADPKGPNARLLDGTNYWSRTIWSDMEVWSNPIADPLNKISSRQICESLAGYENAKQLFAIDSPEIGHFGTKPRSLHTRAVTTKPLLIDSVRWWNPIEDKKATCDWNDFLRIYINCTAAANRYTWLNDWKQSAPERKIALSIIGDVGIGETNMGFEIIPTWNKLGLVGQPEYELTIYDTNGRCGELFFGSQESKILFMKLHSKRTSGGKSSHWLDKLTVDSPFCLTVDLLGRVEKHHLISQR